MKRNEPLKNQRNLCIMSDRIDREKKHGTTDAATGDTLSIHTTVGGRNKRDCRILASARRHSLVRVRDELGEAGNLLFEPDETDPAGPTDPAA